MPTKKPAPLPEALRYLQPFANALAKLRPEDLNENVDASRLEAALRKRVRDLDLEAAEEQLAKDRDRLESWLEAQPDHPAHWIAAYISSPTLAFDLSQPPEPPPRGPEMLFEAPKGWKAKSGPFALELKAGKIVGSIMAVDESGFDDVRRQHDSWDACPKMPHGIEGSWRTIRVEFGECVGWKYLYVQTAPAPWKQVKYALRVPGGYVSAMVGRLDSADFDESTFEAALHTLRLSAPA